MVYFAIFAIGELSVAIFGDGFNLMTHYRFFNSSP
jgi:hypothetical protein